MFFVGLLIGAIVGGSICGIAMAVFCIAKNADLLDDVDRLRGGADAQ
jgi:hypothetical protein